MALLELDTEQTLSKTALKAASLWVEKTYPTANRRGGAEIHSIINSISLLEIQYPIFMDGIAHNVTLWYGTSTGDIFFVGLEPVSSPQNEHSGPPTDVFGEV